MFDYQKHFDAFCREHCLELRLSFAMPAGYETAYGTFDVTKKTVFVNAACLRQAPDHEQAFFLFHELRHALQYLRPELFSGAILRSLPYTIQFDGTCWKLVDGKYLTCRLDGGAEVFADVYLGQPYEADANRDAYEQVKRIFGDSDALRTLYAFWTPKQRVSEEAYAAYYDLIDAKAT